MVDNKGGYPRESMQEAGYSYAGCIRRGLHVLKKVDTGRYETWATHKNCAGYAIVWRNTELEFVRSANEYDLQEAGIIK
jgi:hypothetical protein